MGFRKYFSIAVILSLLLLAGLSWDNILWIDASPEWLNPHVVVNTIGEWTGVVRDYTFGQMMDYVFGYRIYTVWTNWRDITAAITFGILGSLFVLILNKVFKVQILRDGLFKKKPKKRRKKK